MNKLNNLCALLLFILLPALSSSSLAQVPVPSAEDEVIAVTYKIWKAEMSKDLNEMNKYVADDYTEFNPDFSTRIDGKSTYVKLSDPSTQGEGTVLAAEMLNPKVQVYGDVAILSYNYAGVTKGIDGKITSSKAKSTRVYVKMNGEWRLVHGNFALDPNN